MSIWELDNGDFSCVEQDEKFIIDDDIKAAWAIRKIREREQELLRSIQWYKDNIRKCEEHMISDTVYLKKLLYAYFQTVPSRETPCNRIYDMPEGRLVLRKPRKEFVYDKDAQDKLVSELKNKGLKCVKVRESVDWKTLKSSLVERSGHVYSISEDGEATELDNVSIEEKQAEFIVKGE